MCAYSDACESDFNNTADLEHEADNLERYEMEGENDEIE